MESSIKQRIISQQNNETEIMNDALETLKTMLETVEQAIRNGDWIVDGRCDPDAVIARAESILLRNGYRRDSLAGEEFIYEG